MYTRSDILTTAASLRPPCLPSRLDGDPIVPLAFAERVAIAWDAAPRVDEAHAESWRALARCTDVMFEAFARALTIELVPDDPYPSLEAIAADVLERERLFVWTGASVHPLWSPAENHRFRAIHDLVPHVAMQRPITLLGEMQAYFDHLRFVDEASELALFTEVVVYACIYYTRGRFPDEQKAAAFPELLDEYQRMLAS